MNHNGVSVRKEELERRMMQYSGGGGNICDTCGRGYRWSTGLSRHKRLECGKEAQFQCPHCTYRAKQKVNLFAHIRRKHPSDVSTNVSPKLQLISPIYHLLNWQQYLNITQMYLCTSLINLGIAYKFVYSSVFWGHLTYKDYSGLSFKGLGWKEKKTCNSSILVIWIKMKIVTRLLWDV